MVKIHLKRNMGNHERELSDEQKKCIENGEQLIHVMQKIIWKFID